MKRPARGGEHVARAVKEIGAEFARVRELFQENFERFGEVGAAVAVHLDGELVVDLWGGLARRDEGLAWERDTLVPMMSVNKAEPPSPPPGRSFCVPFPAMGVSTPFVSKR